MEVTMSNSNKQNTPLLDTVSDPSEIRGFSEEQLYQLATELRQETIRVVSITGGHLGASLGVVELTVALHFVFNTPKDRLIWDVGHQCYPHKILTGRREKMLSRRRLKKEARRNEKRRAAPACPKAFLENRTSDDKIKTTNERICAKAKVSKKIAERTRRTLHLREVPVRMVRIDTFACTHIHEPEVLYIKNDVCV